VRQRIRNWVQDGADQIKVLWRGGADACSNPNRRKFTLEELQAAVDEAAHSGCAWSRMRTRRRESKRDSAGVASIEHRDHD